MKSKKKTKVKKSLPNNDLIRELALYKARHSCISDDISFNPEAKIVYPETEDEGYWVEAWIYVRKDEVNDEEGKDYYREV